MEDDYKKPLSEGAPGAVELNGCEWAWEAAQHTVEEENLLKAAFEATATAYTASAASAPKEDGGGKPTPPLLTPLPLVRSILPEVVRCLGQQAADVLMAEVKDRRKDKIRDRLTADAAADAAARTAVDGTDAAGVNASGATTGANTNVDPRVSVEAAAEAAASAEVASGSVTLDWAQVKQLLFKTTLTDISMSLKPGSMVAVVGEVASGKSTLAGGILSLVRPTSFPCVPPTQRPNPLWPSRWPSRWPSLLILGPAQARNGQARRQHRSRCAKGLHHER